MTATVTDDPLRPATCPRCDYRFHGLPAATVCPECGRAYDGITVYLFGNGAGPSDGVSRLLGRWTKQWGRPNGVRM